MQNNIIILKYCFTELQNQYSVSMDLLIKNIHNSLQIADVEKYLWYTISCYITVF